MSKDPCLRVGCDLEALFCPKLVVPASGIKTEHDQPFVALLPTLHLCATHINEVKPSHFPNLKELFAKKVSAVVDWKNAKFEGVRLGSEEYKALDV